MYGGGQYLESFAEGGPARNDRAAVARAAYRHPTPRRAIGGGRRRTDLAWRLATDRRGDVVPVDGTVVEGVGVLDQSALTGESLRRYKVLLGEAVLSGSTNVGEAFDLLTTRRAAESTYAGIVRLVEAAQRARAPMSRMADRYAILFLAVTIVLAAAAWALTDDPIRAVAVLVAATPCPLILAVPVAIVSGLSRAAKLGILIKGGKAIETLARVRSLVIDKTGTLTVGQATIVSAQTADGVSADDLLRIAASLDQASKHVIAQTIVAEARSRGLMLVISVRRNGDAGRGCHRGGRGSQGRRGRLAFRCRQDFRCGLFTAASRPPARCTCGCCGNRREARRRFCARGRIARGHGGLAARASELGHRADRAGDRRSP